MSDAALGLNPRLGPDSAALLAAIIDSSFDAIVSKDLDSVITSWNLAAERLFGYTAEEAIGQSVLMLIPQDRRDEEKEIIGRIRLGERVASFETVRRRKNGEFIAVSITVSPIRTKDGAIVGASKIARDITGAKDSERRIRLLLQEVNHRVKNQFAVILAMIRETRRRAPEPELFEQLIRARITALAKSHDLLVGTNWAGASLFELAQKHLEPFAHAEQASLSGPLVTLEPNAVQYLGIAFHELATNSAKYGALSQASGRLQIEWKLVGADDERHLLLEWNETFVPQLSERRLPGRKGFGSTVLERLTPEAVSGEASLERSVGSVRWVLQAPLAGVIHRGPIEFTPFTRKP